MYVIFLTLWYLGTFDGVDKPSVLTLFSKHEEGQVAKSMLNFDKKQGFREKHSETENRDVEMVDEYYTLVTDFCEYGWGDSFHFAHTKKGENHHDAMARHERRLAEELGLTANRSCY